MIKLWIFYCITLAIFSCLLPLAQESNWPNWRGLNQNGISSESQWELSLPEGGINILWQVDIGRGHSSFAVYGKYLYTMGNINKKQDVVYCLDTETGKEIWRYEYACEGGSFIGPRATPTTDGEHVYTFSRNGHLCCLDAKTGTEKWKKNLTEEWGVTNLMHGLSSSPCLVGDLVIVNAGAYGFAFDKKTGEKIWSSDPKTDCGYATPVSFSMNGENAVAMFAGDGLSLVQAATGKRILFFPWKTEYALNASDPVLIGDQIFLCSWNDTGAALIKIKENQASIVWQNEGLRSTFSTPVILDGYLYGFAGSADMKSQLKCADLATGQEKWSHECKYGSIILADQKLIVLDEQGQLLIIKASPSGYEEISQCTIFKPSREMRSWTSPVLCQGKLFLRNSLGKVICIQLKAKKAE